MLTNKLFAPIVSIIVVLATGLLGEHGFDLVHARILQEQRAKVTDEIGHYRTVLESQLSATLYPANGLLAYVKSHPILEPKLVWSLLKTLYDQSRHVRDIGLAPGNRLTYLYPIQGNEKAVGLYYPDLPDQWPTVQRAIQEKKPTLAGPLKLQQGGVGLIYRVPIFVGDTDKYWGLLSMVVDQQSLFSEAGIAPYKNGMQLALRGKDGTGSKGEVFMGDAALFSDDSIMATINLPGGTWQIAAKPLEGWSTGNRVSWIRGAGWVGGMLLGILLYFANASVTRRLRAELALRDSEQRWKFALEGAGHGVWDWNIQTGDLFLSRQEMSVLGYEGEGPTHTQISEWVERQHPDDRDERKKAIDDYFSGKAPLYACEFRTRSRDGRWIWIVARGMLVSRTSDGKPLRMIGTHTDITERKQAEAELEQLANTDPLTGVANRRVFLNEAENEFFRYKRSGRVSALLMMDIDHFKQVNDAHGHATGDAVLRHIAGLSARSLRRTDRFGRLGGEEFAFLLPETDRSGAWEFASNIRKLLEQSPAPTAVGDITVTVSIGIALFRSDDINIDSVISRADMALYRAKDSGRNRVECEPVEDDDTGPHGQDASSGYSSR